MSTNATLSRVLSSTLAALTAVAGFASSSCASPRLPGGGYPLRSYAGGYELQVLIDGAPAQTFDRGGETYVLGHMGARYTLRVVNHTGRRIEAVLSIDGRDAIDGKPADPRSKRGYLVPAWGTVDVDGWRLSKAEVAAFRFSSVGESYAARTGSARDVGVIGVAVFPERFVPPPRPVYTPPPRYPEWRYDDRYGDGGLGFAPPADKAATPHRGRDEETLADESRAKSSAASGSIGPAPAPSASSPRAEAESSAKAPSQRPGLGTEFGEATTSPVQEVSFARANATRPAVILGARYNDRDGLIALGIDVDGCCGGYDDDLAYRQTATPFPVRDRSYAAPPAGWQGGCCVRY